MNIPAVIGLAKEGDQDIAWVGNLDYGGVGFFLVSVGVIGGLLGT